MIPKNDIQDLQDLWLDDRSGIGRAFAKALVPSIPERVKALLEDMEKIGVASGRHYAVLRRQPDVHAGGPEADALARVGLSPLSIAMAADGIGMLVERAIDAGAFDGSKTIVLHIEEGKVTGISQPDVIGGTKLDQGMLINTIMRATRLESGACAIVLHWLAGASQDLPKIFSGFETVRDETGALRLKQVLDAETNVAEAWSRPAAKKPRIDP